MDCLRSDDALRLLWRDRVIGAASKLAFAWLWARAGQRPAEIMVNAVELGEELGRDPAAARQWLNELARHDLLQIGERDRRRGVLQVFVYHPNPAQRGNPCDPQQRLPFTPAAAAPARAEVLPAEPPRHSENLRGAEVLPSKPPSDGGFASETSASTRTQGPLPQTRFASEAATCQPLAASGASDHGWCAEVFEAKPPRLSLSLSLSLSTTTSTLTGEGESAALEEREQEEDTVPEWWDDVADDCRLISAGLGLDAARPLPEGTYRLILAIALMARGPASREWFLEALPLVRNARGSRPGYLRGCLIKRLAESENLCRPEECHWLFGQLERQCRPITDWAWQRQLARRAGRPAAPS